VRTDRLHCGTAAQGDKARFMDEVSYITKFMPSKHVHRWVTVGLGCIVELYYRYPLHTKFTKMIGASVSEATMRLDPRSPATTSSRPTSSRASSSTRSGAHLAEGAGATSTRPCVFSLHNHQGNELYRVVRN
jgi:hypothetical protein